MKKSKSVLAIILAAALSVTSVCPALAVEESVTGTTDVTEESDASDEKKEDLTEESSVGEESSKETEITEDSLSDEAETIEEDEEDEVDETDDSADIPDDTEIEEEVIEQEPDNNEREYASISDDDAFFLGKTFQTEDGSEYISFEEKDGEVCATWTAPGGGISFPLYVTWNDSKTEFSRRLSRQGVSWWGFISELDVYGALFRGTLCDDGTWNISIHNSQGNRLIGNNFVLIDSEGNGELTLEPSYECYEGDTITVSGTYVSSDLEVDVSFGGSDGDALSFSGTNILEPADTGKANTWIISTEVTTKKAGTYEISLSVNDVIESSTITVKPKKELSFDINVSNVVVIGEEGQLWASAHYGFINQDTAIEEAKNIKWTCSDTSAVEVYDYAYNLEGDEVYITFFLRGKKPGSFTVTGTAPDGRTASTSVVVEPKIVAVSDKLEIKETTDVVMLQTTLDNPNKEYLTALLNGITCEIKDDIGALGGAESSKVEISDDGKTGKLIYTLKPIYGGSCEFTLISDGGQKVVETIYSGLNEYPYATPYVNYTWSFNNYSDVPLSIQEDEMKRLTEGMYPVLKRFITEKINSAGDGGVCYGLADTSVLACKKILPLNDIELGLSSLNNASKSSKAKSMIAFYHLNQYCDAIIIEEYAFERLSQKEQLEQIEKAPKPLVLVFECEGWGAHAIVGYRVEEGDWTITHNSLTGGIDYHSTSGGVYYNRRLLTYDSNSVDPEGSYLYFNTESWEWEIPNYYDDYNGKMSSSKEGHLCGAHSNYESLSACGVEAFKQRGMFLWGQEDSFTLLTEKKQYDISAGLVSDGITAFYDITGSQTNKTAKDINVYVDHCTDFTVFPNNNSQLDISVLDSEFYYSATIDTYDSASFDTEGCIAVEGITGDYSLGITSNEDYSDTPFYTFCVEGNNAGDISVNIQDDGLHIQGSNLEGVTITGENDESDEVLNITTDSEEVLITGDETGLHGLIDENKDGTFEKEITETEPSVTISGTDAWDGDEYGFNQRELNWRFENNRTLRINYKGLSADETYSLQNADNYSWKEYKNSVLELHVGKNISNLGKTSLDGYPKLRRVFFEYDPPSFMTNNTVSSPFTGKTLEIYYPADNAAWNSVTGSNYGGNITWQPCYSGVCGNDMTWVLDSKGALVISGSGDMDNYDFMVDPLAPWNDYSEKIKKVVIEQGVTKIGTYSFYGLTNLESVNISSTVKEIGLRAFYGCNKLNSVTLPVGVSSLDNGCFGNCTSLQSVTMPTSMVDLGQGVFENCSNLQSIRLPAGITSIPKSTFKNCNKLKTIELPNTITSIGDSAFYKTGITNIDLPDSLGTIGSSCFYGTSLTQISIPNSVSTIGDFTFTECAQLTSIGLPDSLKVIERQMVSYCPCLEELTIPASVTRIENEAFLGCNSLKKVAFKGDAPEFAESAFGGVNGTVYYPSSSDTWSTEKRLQYGGTITWETNSEGDEPTERAITDCLLELEKTVYQYDGNPKRPKVRAYYNGVVLEEGIDYSVSYDKNLEPGEGTVAVTGIGNYTGVSNLHFSIQKIDEIIDSGNCGNNLSWKLDSNGVLLISGNGEMKNWTIESLSPWNKYASDIKKVIIQDGVTSIGDLAFYNCQKLNAVSLGNTVKSLGKNSFMMTYDLSEISIPDSVEVIKESAFACSWLEKLSLGKGVQRIEKNAFGGNFALTSVIFPESITYLGESLFDGIGFKEIYFCGEAPEMGFRVFVNEENATVYYPVWSKTWDEDTRNSQYWGTITWKTWNPGNKKKIEEAKAALDESVFTFRRSGIKPSVSVIIGNQQLKKGVDYEVVYSNNTNIGTAKVIITGIGSYYGSLEKTFTIKPKSLKPAIILSKASFTYNGKTQKPTVTVKDGTTTLTTKDYTVTYPSASTSVGTYKVTVTLKGNYTGTGSESYTIAARQINPIVAVSPVKYVYNGKARKPSVTVKDGSTTLAASNYTVTYAKGCRNPGTYKVTVTLKGNYAGTKAATFRINPKATKLSKLTSTTAKKITVKWKKQSAQTTGYQIQYATDSKFKKNKKTVTLKGAKKTSKTISGLKAGKKYYVRIRTYKKVGSKNLYSAWSKSKSIKVKK